MKQRKVKVPYSNYELPPSAEQGGQFVDFNKVIEIDPEDAWAYANRGGVNQKLGKYFDAIYDFTRAIEINPEEYYYFERCNSKYEMEYYESALEDCDKALLINSKYKYAYDLRGDVRFLLGDKKGACTDYKNAIANGYKPRKKYLSSRKGKWCRNMY